MPAFRVIAALDLRGGLVVQAKAGNRERYVPVDSVLTSSASPVAIMEALVTRLGIRDFYLADLDAIGGKWPGNLDVLEEIRHNSILATVSIMIDAGLSSTAAARAVLERGADTAVVGTETLDRVEDLEDILQVCGTHRVAVSVDLRGTQVVSRCPALHGRAPDEVLVEIQPRGAQTFILLDMGRVGTGLGVEEQTVLGCLRALAPGGKLLVGGGVRTVRDLLWLRSAGAAGAIVATALHRAAITATDLAELARGD